jgi:signal transduction histidine kinase
MTQIPMHLDYIIMELLKNAVRAQIENRMEKEPIEVTIAAFPKEDNLKTTPKDAQQHTRSSLSKDPKSNVAQVSSYTRDKLAANTASPSTTGVTIRIRDRGGGISPANLANIWKYSFTTFSEEKIKEALYGMSGDDSKPSDMTELANIPHLQLAGLGYGLPLGRAYAEYFGGGIQVQSLWGWGTDVYLTFRGIKWDGIEDRGD